MRGSRGPRQPGGGKQTAGPRHRNGRPFRPSGTGGKRPSKGGDPRRASLEARSRRAPQDDGEREGAAPQHRKGSFRHPETRAKARPEGRRPERFNRDSFEARPERSEGSRERSNDRRRQNDGEREEPAPQHRQSSSRHPGARAHARPEGRRPERFGRDPADARPRRSGEARELRYDHRRQDDEQRGGAAPRRRKSSLRHPEAAVERPSKGDGQPSRQSPTWRSSKQSKSHKPISVGRASFEVRQRRAPQDDGEHARAVSPSADDIRRHPARVEETPPSVPTTVQNVAVTGDEAGMRVDRFLEARFPGLSFSHIQRVIRKGELRVNGKRTQPKNRLEAGQTVRIPPLRLDAPKPRAGGSEADEKTRAFLQSITLYEDADVMVLNKPMGLAVQGGSGTTRHVDGMLEVLRDAHGQRPRLVHRLDKDTAGCLLVAKTRFAATALAKTFRSRSARKIYWALVASVPKVQQGRISTYLVKEEREDESFMRIARHGEKGASHAVTYYAVVETSGPLLSWLSLKPVTGRTHQLRAHMAHINHPIVGDPKYFSRENWELPGGMQNKLHLLARRIAVPHPRGGVVDVTAPLPPHMQQSWNLLGFDAARYDPIVEAPEE